MKRSIFAIIAGLLLAAGISTVALAQWPTTCVEANDAFERYVGNEHNVGIYQRTFGDGPEAEQACQNDHREDIRAAFNWAIPESTPATAPTPVEPPPPPAKDYGNWRYTNRDGTHWAWISSSSLNAALEVRCGETTRRFPFLVYLLWYNTPDDALSDLDDGEYNIKVQYRWHRHAAAYQTHIWWEGGWRVFLPDDRGADFARLLIRDPGISFRVRSETSSRTYEADFDNLGTDDGPDHPIRQVMRVCAKT